MVGAHVDAKLIRIVFGVWTNNESGLDDISDIVRQAAVRDEMSKLVRLRRFLFLR